MDDDTFLLVWCRKGGAVKQPDSKYTALYTRLSKEDLQTGDSVSIENQKAFLQEYARRNGFGNIKFYIDDGWSGARFDNRPGLNSLRDDMRAGNVATVIIKDQSRIGRDVVEIGLLKRDFDEYGIRFIAVADNLDTANGFDVMSIIRDVFNEYYLADTSKKIKTVKQAQAKRGERVNGNAPYGYLIDPDNKHHLIPDPETVHVVKQVFDMFVQGMRVCQIQDWLRENGIVTVTELMYQRKGNGRHSRPLPEFKCNWPDKSIYDILTRKEYLGHTVTGKTYKVSYKSNKTVRNSEEDQHIFYNTHEPLITEEAFELAQKRIETRNRPTKVDEIDIFSGLVFCGDCESRMNLLRGKTRTKDTESYTCGRYRSGHRARTTEPCTSHFIRKAVVAELVLADLQRVLAYVKEHQREYIQQATEQNEAETKKQTALTHRELESGKKRLNELDTLFRKLYEDHAFGRITDVQFTMLTSGFEDEKTILRTKALELERGLKAATKRRDGVERFLQVVNKYTHIDELTYENLHELIDRILIFEPDKKAKTRKIEIIYSFVGRIDSGEMVTRDMYATKLGGRITSIVT